MASNTLMKISYFPFVASGEKPVDSPTKFWHFEGPHKWFGLTQRYFVFTLHKHITLVTNDIYKAAADLLQILGSGSRIHQVDNQPKLELPPHKLQDSQSNYFFTEHDVPAQKFCHHYNLAVIVFCSVCPPVSR